MTRSRAAGLGCLLSAFILEASLPLLPGAPVLPLVLLTVIYFSLYEGPFFGSLLGLAAATLVGLVSSAGFGVTGAAYALIGFMTGVISHKFFRDSALTQMLCAGGGIYAAAVIGMWGLQDAAWGPVHLSSVWHALWHSNAVISALLAPFVFKLFAKIAGRAA